MELVKAAVASIEDVESMPEPVCIFTSFGESALNFELRIWVRRSDDWPNVRSAALVAIYHVLGEAGIEIPFPQRDLHVRTLDVARPAAALAGALDGTLKS
jgi:small-conductance mechanosensitive channel